MKKTFDTTTLEDCIYMYANQGMHYIIEDGHITGTTMFWQDYIEEGYLCEQ